MQVELGQIGTGELGEFGDGSDAVLVTGGLAAPDRQWSAPVAIAGERPVDVALEPLAESTVLDELGVPSDRVVLRHEQIAMLGGAHEP